MYLCFVWIWEQTAIISLYSINWLVFITETECLLRGTDWIFICNSTFCPHSVLMCFVWIWEQTTIISLYSINWRVCITETECVYCAVRTELCTACGTLGLKVAHWWRQSYRLLWSPVSFWKNVRCTIYIDMRQWRHSQLFAASRYHDARR